MKRVCRHFEKGADAEVIGDALTALEQCDMGRLQQAADAAIRDGRWTRDKTLLGLLQEHAPRPERKVEVTEWKPTAEIIETIRWVLADARKKLETERRAIWRERWQSRVDRAVADLHTAGQGEQSARQAGPERCP